MTRAPALGVAVIGLGLALALVACGPPRIAGDGHADDGDNSGSEGPVEPPEPPDLPDPTTDSDTWAPTTSTTSATDGFVPDNDYGVVEQCDPFLQDCPDGEKCVPYGSTGGNWDANKCVPVLGDQAVGEPCTYGGVVEATDDCDETSHCWNVMDIEGEPIGTCHAFCTGTADDPMCPPGSSCTISGSGDINLCIPTCDPVLQDCSPGLACYWAYNDFNCIFTTQDIPPGDPCGYINDCAAGLLCTSAEALPDCAGSACCSPFCELPGGDGPCVQVPGTECVPFFEEGMSPPGYENVGICLLPEAGP